VKKALARFIEVFNCRVRDGFMSGFEIVIVHGHSSTGTDRITIKSALASLCNRYLDRMLYIPGGKWGNNPGRSSVVPLLALPGFNEKMWCEIIEFPPPEIDCDEDS
jgi:hypothetical protein